jgi:hypothetical protein
MKPPVLYEYSDFNSPEETCAQRRHRLYPQPTRRARLAVILPGVGLGLAVALMLIAARWLVVA